MIFNCWILIIELLFFKLVAVIISPPLTYFFNLAVCIRGPLLKGGDSNLLDKYILISKDFEYVFCQNFWKLSLENN